LSKIDALHLIHLTKPLAPDNPERATEITPFSSKTIRPFCWNLFRKYRFLIQNKQNCSFLEHCKRKLQVNSNPTISHKNTHMPFLCRKGSTTEEEKKGKRNSKFFNNETNLEKINSDTSATENNVPQVTRHVLFLNIFFRFEISSLSSSNEFNKMVSDFHMYFQCF
jgi:hypothetical protein